MSRRRGGNTEVGNVKEKEEIDIYRTVFIDTNLDTHLAVVISELDSVSDLKKKVMLEHLQCFPKLGEIIIQAFKVKRKDHFYHLSDSMRVNRAFEGVKSNWFLSVDAFYLKQLGENEQSCRPNMSNQLPVLCLPYNLSNAECNTDDASTSAILKSASVECLRNQKAQLPGDSCREFSEDKVRDLKGTSTDILKNVSADSNRVPDLPTAGTISEHETNRVSNIQCSNSVQPSPEIGLPVEKKKQKIKKQNVNELGDFPVKENTAINNVSSADALHHEFLLSANMLVHTEKAEHKEGDALHKIGGLACTSSQTTSKQETILPKDQHNSQIFASNTISPESTDTDQMTVSVRTENMKSKKKRNEMNLPSASNHERASFPLSVKDFTVEDKVKEINILSPESTDKSKKKRKRKRNELNLSSASNHERGSFPLSVKDFAVEDKAKENNIPLSHVTGDVLLSSTEIPVPAHLLVNTERKERKEIGDPLKESKALVSTSEQDMELPRNSEEQNNSPNIVLDTLSSDPADNQHLRTSPGIKNKRAKKKGKKDTKRTDVTFNLPSAVVLPSSVQVTGGEESFQEKNIASNCNEDESHHEVALPLNLVVNAERTEREGISGDGYLLKENKVLVSRLSTNETSTQEIGMTGNFIEDRHNSQKIAVDTLSPEAADNEHLRTETGTKSKKNKKKRKTDSTMNISNSIGLPSSAKDGGGAKSLNKNNSASNYVSAENEARPESAVLANLLVECEKIRDPLEQDKDPVSSKKTSAQGTGVTGTRVEDQHNSQTVVNKGSVSKHKNTSTHEIGLKGNFVQDQNNSQKVVVDTLSPELADSEHLGTSSSIKNKKKKRKRKMDETLALSTVNVLPSSVQDVAREKNLKKHIPSHDDELQPEIVIQANLVVNADRPEREEISTNVDSVNVQSENMIEDNTQSQPAVFESESDRIDFKHYFLPGKAEDKVAGSDKNGITRSERDDKTKKNTKKITASLKTSHDQAPVLRSSENQEGGVKSHIKCSTDIDPQASFSKDASSISLRPSKKSTSNVNQKRLPSSYEPDQVRTPHSVLRAIGKGKKVSSATSSLNSSSESFDKSDQGTKSKNRVSNADRRLVACAKASTKGTSEVKSRPPPRKSLLATPGSIFKDDSSESSDDEGGSEQLDARTASDDVLSSDSDMESEIGLDSTRKGSSDLEKKEDGENTEKRSSSLRNTTLDMILRSSSRYKKAKLTAESQPEVEDSESQPVDCVPDSQANP